MGEAPPHAPRIPIPRPVLSSNSLHSSLPSMPSSNPVAHIQNNTASWWWKDPGLRRLAIGISLGFSTSVSMGA
jgi:hypothetical protein